MVLNDEIAFNVLKKKIWDRTGVDCSKYKDNYLKRRIDLRMKAIGIGSSYNEYYRFLEKNPPEYDALLDGITINVTEFFRDSDTFDAFKNEVIPQLLSEKVKRNIKILRIWSAACSIGEEPYTIGIVLHEKLGPELKNFLVSIHATDIDVKALSAARAGIYDAQTLKKNSKLQVSRYFDAADGNDKYRIKDNVKHLVRFQQHDLISGRKFSHFDIICRNVMIYFGKELQSRLFLDFYDALNDGGYLIIGKTETMFGEAKEKFVPVNTKERIYKKNSKG